MYQIQFHSLSALPDEALLLKTSRGAFQVELKSAVKMLQALNDLGTGNFVEDDQLLGMCGGDRSILSECLEFFGSVAGALVQVRRWPRPNFVLMRSQSLDLRIDPRVLASFGMQVLTEPDSRGAGPTLTVLIERGKDASATFDQHFEEHPLLEGDIVITAVVERDAVRMNPPRGPTLLAPCHRCCQTRHGDQLETWDFVSPHVDYLAVSACIHFVGSLFRLDDSMKFTSDWSFGASYDLLAFRRTTVVPHQVAGCACGT